MQAQHKAVLKDLRRGHFDDKIDSYLGGTPGLLPRGAEEPAPRETGSAAAIYRSPPAVVAIVPFTAAVCPTVGTVVEATRMPADLSGASM